MMKKTISSRVSDTPPPAGHPISATPAAIASTAENSDHQNPGACRIRKVMTRPTTPLTRNSQPRKISTASVAIGGMMTAAAPSTTRITPSISKKRQLSRSALATLRSKRSVSDGWIDMTGLPLQPTVCTHVSGELGQKPIKRGPFRDFQLPAPSANHLFLSCFLRRANHAASYSPACSERTNDDSPIWRSRLRRSAARMAQTSSKARSTSRLMTT